MRNALADLAVESEAALALTLRIGRAMDEAAGDESAAALARITTAAGKYWICKRAPGRTYEAMECHGGPSHIEESTTPRLYRKAPLNSIWAGSGNVMCLDVLRAILREKAALPAFLVELDAAAVSLKDELNDPVDLESRSRGITEMMAITQQGALLVQHGPAAVLDALCASHLGTR